MLTVDFAKFPVGKGNLVLDLGSGTGRHAAAAQRFGAQVVAVDLDAAVLKDARDTLAAVPGSAAVRADGLALPFADDTFERVIISEVLEHVPDDRAMIAEAVRVLAPGGLMAVTVPRWWPERVCWALSDEYHQVEGGHVRIYRRRQLLALLRDAGVRPLRTHHAHALHSPYWWLKCTPATDSRFVELYHEFLCWDIMSNPWPVRMLEQALNPVLGKCFVVYARL
ncbi:methyltransferase family protein [Herbihabitans rhizosphaerae]|uniref:Methyltransferase family protein n=1 Tax=Herbihabitans rhizosphaerae TaxID=1872711 RepID=A0A4Q7L4G5_9PSEU|nr:class I SAM-dependent methyltransferase [Herbihabitans rhizosphaerae]RZS43391.1 methyltransferase family protein [Herbihabitans rhizosphaerae]